MHIFSGCQTRWHPGFSETTVFGAGFPSKVWYMRCGHEKFNLSSTDPQNVVTNTKAGT